MSAERRQIGEAAGGEKYTHTHRLEEAGGVGDALLVRLGLREVVVFALQLLAVYLKQFVRELERGKDKDEATAQIKREQSHLQ